MCKKFLNLANKKKKKEKKIKLLIILLSYNFDNKEKRKNADFAINLTPMSFCIISYNQ